MQTAVIKLLSCVLFVLVPVESSDLVAQEPNLDVAGALRTAGAKLYVATDGSPLHVFGDGLPVDKYHLLVALKELRWLSLNDSNLTDEACKTLSQLDHLTQLSIAKGNITGSGLSALLSLPKLETLMIDDSSIAVDDKAAQGFRSPLRLRRVKISGSLITNGFVDMIAKCQTVEYVSFSACKLTDDRLARLLPCKQLKALGISHEPQITDGAIDTFLEFDELRELWIARTGITDPAVATLKGVRPKWLVTYQ